MKTPTNVDEAIQFLYNNIHLNTALANFFDVGLYLGNCGDERAFSPLIKTLQEGGEYMRASAASGLGYLGKKEAVPYLIRAFLDDRGRFVRCDAALALGRLGAEEALPHFSKMFPSEHFEVQKRIAMAVGMIKTEKGIETLRLLDNMMENPAFSEHNKIEIRKFYMPKDFQNQKKES